MLTVTSDFFNIFNLITDDILSLFFGCYKNAAHKLTDRKMFRNRKQPHSDRIHPNAAWDHSMQVEKTHSSAENHLRITPTHKEKERAGNHEKEVITYNFKKAIRINFEIRL